MLRETAVTRRLTVFAETRLRCSRDRAWISGIARLVTTLNFVAETREIKSPLIVTEPNRWTELAANPLGSIQH